MGADSKTESVHLKYLICLFDTICFSFCPWAKRKAPESPLFKQRWVHPAL